MKYIVLRVLTDGGDRDIPFAFPNFMVHLDVANRMMHHLMDEHKWHSHPVAAGEISFFCGVTCGGRSDTLGVGSREEYDERLFQMYDYTHGLL